LQLDAETFLTELKEKTARVVELCQKTRTMDNLHAVYEQPPELNLEFNKCQKEIDDKMNIF